MKLPEALSSYLDNTHDSEHGISLGTKTHVLAQKRCPFCRLATYYIRSYPDLAKMPEDTRLFVQKDLPSLGDFSLTAIRADGSSVPKPLTIRIVHCNDNEPLSRNTARRVDADRPLNISRFKHWLEICDENHHSTCASNSAGQKGLETLRLIDAVRMSVVQSSLQAKYAALSYVWGDAEPIRLYKADVSKFGETGSLISFKPQIPKVIQDAIEFVKMIGERYLWVDCLCLIQDDAQELQQGIESMDMIYERAYFTIIAANAPNANVGLPGVCRRSPIQHIETIKVGMEFMFMCTLEGHLRNSIWATRGWT